MKLIIGNDHAGIELKKEIVAHLHEQGYIVQDVGVDTGERSDYPIVAKAVAQAISDKEYDLGILICGTGIGMSIAANKYPGVRAAAVSDGVLRAPDAPAQQCEHPLPRTVGRGGASALSSLWTSLYPLPLTGKAPGIRNAWT